MIYFAYGSNMDEARICERCPSARFLFKAKLPAYRLDFTRFSTGNNCGAADVIPDPSAAVWGVVYEINDKDKPALEKFEGVPIRAYEPCTVEVQPDGDHARLLQATTYVVVTKLDPRPRPNAEYKARIVNGAKHWKLPAEYIASLEKIEVA